MSGIERSSMAQLLSGGVPDSAVRDVSDSNLSSIPYQSQEDGNNAMLTPSHSLHDLVGLTDGEAGNWLNQLHSNDFDLGAQLLGQGHDQFSFGNMTMDEFTDQVLRSSATESKLSVNNSPSAAGQPIGSKPMETCTGNEFDSRGAEHLPSDFRHSELGSTGYDQHEKMAAGLNATSSEGMYHTRSGPAFYAHQRDESGNRSSMLTMYDPPVYEDPSIHSRSQFDPSYQLPGFVNREVVPANQQPQNIHLSIPPNQQARAVEHVLSPNHHSPHMMSPSQQARHTNNLLSPHQQTAANSQPHPSTNHVPPPIKVSPPEAPYPRPITGWQAANQYSPSKYPAQSPAPPQWLARGPPSTGYIAGDVNSPSAAISPSHSSRSNVNTTKNYSTNPVSPNKCTNEPASSMSYSSNPVSPQGYSTNCVSSQSFLTNSVGSVNGSTSQIGPQNYLANPASSNSYPANPITRHNSAVDSMPADQPFLSRQVSAPAGSLPMPDRRKNTERSLRDCGLYDAAMLTKRLVQRDKELQSGMDDFKIQLAELLQGLTTSDS